MYTEWQQLFKYNADEIYLDNKLFAGRINRLKKDGKLPDKKDLEGAGQALVRLRETYDLSPFHFSESKLNHTCQT